MNEAQWRGRDKGSTGRFTVPEFWRACALLLLVIPWINPFASGPSPAVMAWLVAAVCALLLWMLPGRIDADLKANALVAAALLSSAMAMLQYFGLAEHLSPWVNAPGVGEAFGNLRQRNQLASLLAMGLAALFYLRGVRSLGWPGLALAALLGTGLASTASRTGLVQWVLVLCLAMAWLWRSPSRPMAMARVALLAYVLAALLLPFLLRAWVQVDGVSVLERLAGAQVDCSSRLVLWGNVLHLIAQRPWVGWGLGELDYAHYITLYPGARFCDILDNAHNLPLHVAVEWGVPAAALLCGALLWWILYSRPWAETRPDRQMAWAVLAVLAVHSMLEYPLWYGPFQITALWCVWHLWITRPSKGMADTGLSAPTLAETNDLGEPSAVQDANLPGRPTKMPLRWAVGLAGLMASGYASWDYVRVSQMYMPPEQRMVTYRDDTLAKVNDSVLFRSQVEFAELATTPMTRANAQRVYQLSKRLLHFSPEARVVERLIESAVLLGRKDEALFHVARYRRAFPADHERWARRVGSRPRPQGVASEQGASRATSAQSGS